jgi:drug/metabolite transporter (DMT)-like permease
MPIYKNLVFWAYTAAFLGVFSHATSEFFSVLSGVSGPEVSVWRYLLGSACLLVVALSLKSSRNLLEPLRKDGLRIVVLSVCGMAVGQLLFHWSLDFASIVQVATMVTTMPMGVMVADAILNKSRITTPKVISGLGAFGGVVFLLTDGYLEQLQLASGAIYGVLMALGCAVVGSIYLVLIRPLINEYGAIRMTTLTFVLGAGALWLVVGLAWGVWIDPTSLFERPPQAYLSLLTLGLWNTCIGFILWLWGLSAAPDMGRANYLFFLKPVIAALLALAILGSSITAVQVAAIVVVCGCVLVEIFYDQLATLFGGRGAD